MARHNPQVIQAAIATAFLLLISTFGTTNAIANNARLSSHCDRQLQWPKMDHCRQYLKSEMEVIMFPSSGNQACCLRECCEMLQDMDEDCVCQALERMAMEETQDTRGGGGEGRKMGRVVLRKAMQLPGRCGISASCESRVDNSNSYYYGCVQH